MKNILIFSNYLPTQGWGGGVIIRSITNNYPKNCKLFWTKHNLKESQVQQTCNNIELLPFKTNFFRGRGISDVILKLESFAIVANFNKLIAQHNIDKVWFVLGASYDNLYTIHQLCANLKVKYHISVHDDPIVEIVNSRKKKASYHFKNLLLKADSIDVISTRMQQLYKKLYNVDSIVITRSIPDDFPQNDTINPNIKTILMGGFGNASEPWPKPLLESCVELNKKQNYKLLLFDPKHKQHEDSNIIVYDLMYESEFNEILKSTTFGYACDDLDENRLHFAQLSLPTKIITYIGAGIPFVYHGPKDGTVGDLVSQFETGIIVDSNDKNDLVNGFLKLQSNYQFYQNNCHLARQTLFSQSQVQKLFFDTFLNNL